MHEVIGAGELIVAPTLSVGATLSRVTVGNRTVGAAQDPRSAHCTDARVWAGSTGDTGAPTLGSPALRAESTSAFGPARRICPPRYIVDAGGF
ncbi:hypothetical protein, partial [Nocardia cyriacigeorgica]|uniref:hypothetical protein n=1 Tax=Nocardia cyriacigeorgica TaxID=135487 RepID=UPI002453C317